MLVRKGWSLARTSDSLGRLVRNGLSSQLLAGRWFSHQSLLLSPDQTNQSSTADFGFKTVPKEKKKGMVHEVFESVAPSYDVMNDLMSGGLHRLWKDRFVHLLRPYAGQQHLDMAGGTGDIGFRVLDGIRAAELQLQERDAAKAVTPGGVVVGDINPHMLEEGRKRAVKRGLQGERCGIQFVVADAEALPFEHESFDSYTIAFGIRNVTQIDLALREAWRVLRPGGRFLCLEFSRVENPLLAQVYDTYSFNVIPQMGRLVADDADSYQYLVESIRKFPDQETFKAMIGDAGFRHAHYENLTFGVVAIHTGFKV